jgi:predicted nuclease with RNAse H fold
MRLVGINLAPYENNATGIATYEDGKIRTFSVYKNVDVMEIINRFKPEVVSIDAPLHVVDKQFRAAEKEMQQMGYMMQPLNTHEMIERAKRASSIRYAIEGVTTVIECHPDSAKKTLKINSVKELKNVRFLNIVKNEHEERAILAIITALFYKEGNYDRFGDEDEGYITLPKIS